MKRYNFRLQRVLDIKQIFQELRERELREANNKLRQEENNLAVLEKETSRQQINARGVEAGTPAFFSLFSGYFSLLLRIKEFQRDRIANAQNEVNVRMKTLMNAFREKKVIENLKERKRQEYVRDSEKEEQNFIDEISGAHKFLEKKSENN